jgi:hypothetical protein
VEIVPQWSVPLSESVYNPEVPSGAVDVVILYHALATLAGQSFCNAQSSFTLQFTGNEAAGNRSPALLVANSPKDAGACVVASHNRLSGVVKDIDGYLRSLVMLSEVERCAVNGNLVLNEFTGERHGVSLAAGSSHQAWIKAVGNVCRGRIEVNDPHVDDLNAVEL